MGEVGFLGLWLMVSDSGFMLPAVRVSVCCVLLLSGIFKALILGIIGFGGFAPLPLPMP